MTILETGNEAEVRKYVAGIASADLGEAFAIIAGRGFTEICRSLYARGVRVDTVVGEKRNNALHLAAAAGHIETCRFLMNDVDVYRIEEFNKIDNKNLDGDTALHLALIGRHMSVVEFLRAKQAGCDIANNAGVTARQMIAEEEAARIAAAAAATVPSASPEPSDDGASQVSSDDEVVGCVVI